MLTMYWGRSCALLLLFGCLPAFAGGWRPWDQPSAGGAVCRGGESISCTRCAPLHEVAVMVRCHSTCGCCIPDRSQDAAPSVAAVILSCMPFPPLLFAGTECRATRCTYDRLSCTCTKGRCCRSSRSCCGPDCVWRWWSAIGWAAVRLPSWTLPTRPLPGGGRSQTLSLCWRWRSDGKTWMACCGWEYCRMWDWGRRYWKFAANADAACPLGAAYIC